MSVVGYYVHHHGAGHAARATSVAAALGRRGVAVVGLSSLPRPGGWTGEWVELPRDDTGATFDDAAAGGALHWAPLRHDGYRDRMAALAAWVAAARPAAVVVDVSVEVTLLVRLLGVPVVVMAMRGLRDDAPHVAAYDAATRLVAPWPAACPEPQWPARWLAKTDHVGALSRFDGEAAPAADVAPRRGLLLWGRGGGDGPDLDVLRAATPGWEWSRPSGDGVQVWRELHEAGVVVCHGGQNAVAEVAAARRPAVVVAEDRPFDEQHHTVRALDRAGLAATAERLPAGAGWAPLVERALALGGDRWAVWHDGHGAERAADAVVAAAGESR